MTTIIGGNNAGVLDSSLFQLSNPATQVDPHSVGAGDELYVNVSNGDLVFQSQDTVLPSDGSDLSVTRTYNSKGLL